MLRSSSPLLLRRRQPASPCSGIHSGKGWGHGVSLGSAAPSPRISGLSSYLVDTPKEGEELAEKSGTHAGNVHKGSLEVGVGCEEGWGLPDLGLTFSSNGRDAFIPPPAITSLPRGIPLPRAHVSPMTLATKVLRVRYSFSTTPRRMVFISGMPDPAEVHIQDRCLTGLIQEA